VCCLMFGEMSIRGKLHFNQKCGCIEGFEDLRNQGRASNVAIIPWSSCSVVSVIKWKQPVAYYLIHRSTKDEVLLNFLMQVFDASHNVALQVVATVFYRGANNQGNETVGFF